MSAAWHWTRGAKYATAPWRFQNYLRLVEHAALAATTPPDTPQLFILGPPRSGTTLVYQYIVHRLHVAYFTNGVGRYPLAPCIVTYAQKCRWGIYVSDFKSQYGKVTGPLAPREAGAFWNRYFDPEVYQDYEDVSPGHISTLRRKIWCVQKIFGGAAFVNKNVKHLLRIHALGRIFPDCIFLVVERDIGDAALSLLRGRQELFGDQSVWWSVRPPNFDSLKDLNRPEQVAKQYLSLVKKMELDLAKLPKSRVLRIHYDQFCHRPETLIEILRSRLEPIRDKNGAITSFEVSKNCPTTCEERELLGVLENG